MYWRHLWHPTATVHAKQNIFVKTHIEVQSPHLYASFVTFCAQIGQLFEAQCVYRRKLSSIPEFFRMFQDSLCHEQLTNLDAKVAKRSVRMWAIKFYKKNSKIFCRTRTVGWKWFVQYIRTSYVHNGSANWLHFSSFIR